MNAAATSDNLHRLATLCEENLERLDQLATLPVSKMQRRPAPRAWTALEALQHLNRFNLDYLQLVEAAVEHPRAQPPFFSFVAPGMARWVADWALPGAATIKLPTLPSMNPRREALDLSVVTAARQNLHRLGRAITASKSLDTDRVTIPTAELKIVRFPLGEALRMLVNHDRRHIGQAERATRGLAGIRTD